MIKLFWNTQNQKKPTVEDDKKTVEKLDVNYVWGKYHKKNSDAWVYEILKNIKYNIIQDERSLEEGDILIIVDSSPEAKSELYTKLKLICSKMFLIHLGDEAGNYNLSEIYNNFNYVWRTFCSNKYFNRDGLKCIPIGYKSGVLYKKKGIRKYKWAFMGTPHKTSRHDLLFQFSDIKPFFCHKTEKFDKKIISVDEMTDILSSSEFMPCPNGFVHPETYRVFEALECECIPIVENTYQYYNRLFPNNPFIKVDIWTEARPIIKGWSKDQINKKREECKDWWSEYKKKLQNSIADTINS